MRYTWLRWVKVSQLDEGRYRVAFSGKEERYEALILPGFWLRVEWLWQEPLPKVLDVLREVGVL